MNKLMKTFFTNLADFTEESGGVIVNAADNLLSYVLPKDDVAAQVCRKICGSCRKTKDYHILKHTCRTCCASFPAVGCYPPFEEICAYRV
jgi:galactokinase/mevalonate kinase-like predicted kinase